MRTLVSIVLFTLLFLGSRTALAEDAGQDAADASVDAHPVGLQPTVFDSNVGCHAAPGLPSFPVPLVLLALACAGLRRRRLALLALLQLWPSPAAAEDYDEPVISRPAPARRRMAFELTPLSLVLRHFGATVELMAGSHHAINLGAYWTTWRTGDDSYHNTFEGAGGELGYRYYWGPDGPRGVFCGASVLAGTFVGIPEVGQHVPFQMYGGAVDFGYQTLVLDRWLIGLGLGLQYSHPTERIPQQELPISVIANPGLRPRLLLALGVAWDL